MDTPSRAETEQKFHKGLTDEALRVHAIEVLHGNDLGTSTRPAPHLYPHLWLWDSCFTVIGLRHLDIERAKLEIFSLFKGQWANGMVPHEIFAKNSTYHAGRKTWRSYKNELAPRGLDTTGITQPPVIAEAIVRIGEKLAKEDRLEFYGKVYPKLLKYHEWLYRERDPYDTGLVTLIHSHEVGMDNIPYWMRLTEKATPLKLRALHTIRQDELLNYMRKDRKVADNPSERLKASEIHTAYHLIAQLRRLGYDLRRILKPTYRRMALVNKIPLIQDVAFNAMLLRANTHLCAIAKELGVALPDELKASVEKAPYAFETLFADGAYWSRSFRSRKLIKEPTIGTFLALYGGTIPQERADALAAALQQPDFWPVYGVTTVPTTSPYFKPRSYWQGPIWVNMNWMIADGLERYGHYVLAERIRQQTIELVREHGMFEYFSSLDGSGAGTDNFSWTAALTLDMLEHERHASRIVRDAKQHKSRLATAAR